jgi:uncharacterized protein
MRTLRRKIVLFMAVFAFVIGCTADYTKQMQASDKLFSEGKYLEAARLLLPNVNKENEDQLLFLMETGLMLHAGGDFKKSNDILLMAGSLADRIAISVSKTAASFLLNDTVTNYRGEDFEIVLIHMYLGINYMMLDNPDEARVEFKKIDNILRGIRDSGAGAYKQNLMAKYLYGIAFEQSAALHKDDNDFNDAYIEYKSIYEKDPNFPDVKLDLLRMAKKIGDTEDYNKLRAKFGALDTRIPADAGEFVMIYQAGMGAIKQSRGKLLADVQMKVAINGAANSMPLQQGVTVAGILAALALADNPIPKWVKRSNKVARIAVSFKGADRSQTYTLEDIETTAIKNMDDQYGSLVGKAAGSIITKVAASLAAAYIAEKSAKAIGGNIGKFSGLIGAATGAATGAGLAANIKPDLRCWHSLPANYQMRRVFLKPGNYDMDIALLDARGSVIQTRSEKVAIAAGKKTLLNYRTLF